MKKLLFALFAIVFALGPPAVAAQQITLLHVNDSHSHLAAWGPKDANLDGTLGGLPKAAAIIAAEKASDTNAILVHAGDFTHGDLFFNEYLGVPELQILKSLGLDALVFGNRDFQLGPDFLNAVLTAAWSDGGVPVLGANIVSGSHDLGKWITPTLMKEANGVKVGLFGLSYKGSLAKPSPVVIAPYLPDLAPAKVTELRNAGAQVIVCITHFGMDRARQLAQTVSGIDVIVNAHDNWETPEPEDVTRPDGGITHIVSAGHLYRWVGRLRLSVEGDSVSVVDYQLIGADAETTPLPWVQESINNLESGIVARSGDVFHLRLAWAAQDIGTTLDPARAKRDTPLGNLMTDAYREWTHTDVAVEALGVLDDPFPRGPVVGADVFRAMSFSFTPVTVEGRQIVRPLELVTFRTKGEHLAAALNKMLELGGDAFPQVSGIRFVYDSERPKEARIISESIKVNGMDLVPDQFYSVTATKYVYDTLVALVLKGKTQDDTVLPDLAFDAARTYVQSLVEIGPWSSNRIRDLAGTPNGKLPSLGGGFGRAVKP